MFIPAGVPGVVLPNISCIGMCGLKGMVSEPLWSEIVYRF